MSATFFILKIPNYGYNISLFMNGVGKRGLKLGFTFLLLTSIAFVVFFFFIYFMSRHNGTNDYEILYPALVAGVLGIISAIFAGFSITKYKKDSKKSPLWLVCLMAAAVEAFPTGLIIMANLPDFKIANLFGSYYSFLFVLFIGLALFLLITNIFKYRILVFLGCILSTVVFTSGTVWLVQNFITKNFHDLDFVYPQINYPFTILCIISFGILAITSFLMIFSVFKKGKKQPIVDHPESEEENK